MGVSLLFFPGSHDSDQSLGLSKINYLLFINCKVLYNVKTNTRSKLKARIILLAAVILELRDSVVEEGVVIETVQL